MNAENTNIAKFIESILFEEYKKADGFLNQIVESKVREKIECACDDKKTAPFKKGKNKKGKNEKGNGAKKMPSWLKNKKEEEK